MVELTLTLTDDEYNRLRLSAQDEQQEVKDWLKGLLDKNLSPVIKYRDEISQLSNEEVLSIADSWMDEQELERLAHLRNLPQLSWAETEEKNYLNRKYWLGQARKTEAMIEAQTRGLRKDDR